MLKQMEVEVICECGEELGTYVIPPLRVAECYKCGAKLCTACIAGLKHDHKGGVANG